MTKPAVAVIIVSYNTRELLARCLTSLENERSTIPCEFVVVDNASSDGSAAMVRGRFPWVRVIEASSNLGFAAGNNLALRAIDTPYALLLNSDTETSLSLLRTLVAWTEQHPAAGAVGCKLVNADGSLQRSCWRFPTPLRALAEAVCLTHLLRRYSNYHEWDYNSERRVDFAIGACLLLRMVAARQIDFFDERYFLYAEEADLCRRLRNDNWETWFTPSCAVLHLGGASSSSPTSQQAFFARDQYFDKWFGPLGMLQLRISQLLGSIVRLGLSSPIKLSYETQSVDKRMWRSGQLTTLRWSLQRLNLRGLRVNSTNNRIIGPERSADGLEPIS